MRLTYVLEGGGSRADVEQIRADLPHLVAAFGAPPADEAICQELAGRRRVQLLHGLLHQLPGI